MKQIWPNYSYSPATNVLTLTGLNIDRDQLLLVTAADRGRIMYNFADSSVTASAFTSGANTALTLVATTAGLTTTAALVIYFDDQATSSTVTGTVELGPTSLNALESITVTMGQVTVTGGLTDVQLRASAVTVGGTVTVGNSLTISSLPAISGTVTISSALPAGTNQIGSVTASISGTVPISISSVTVGNTVAVKTDLDANSSQPCVAVAFDSPGGVQRVGNTNGFPIRPMQDGSGNSIPLAISGTVTIGAGTAQIGSVTVGNSVTIGSLPALVAGTAQIGSVTASISNSITISANPTGPLTTRFGSVTTANTSQLTAAVTNTAREYLFIQNISVGSVTVGVGFSPTTTQGIQLSPGSGITFDSFCPTGAVWWLGATTGAAWTILEG